MYTEENEEKMKISKISRVHAEELHTFPAHLQTSVNYLTTEILPTRPYPRYSRFFNIYRIDLESPESGISRAPSHGQPLTAEEPIPATNPVR